MVGDAARLRCSKCRAEKRANAFAWKNRARSKRHNWCKACTKAYRQSAKGKAWQAGRNKREKARYRSDPEYRKKKLGNSRMWFERKRNDPREVRLMAIRSGIYEARESVALHMKRAEFYEARQLALIHERDAILRELGRLRGKGNGG